MGVRSMTRLADLLVAESSVALIAVCFRVASPASAYADRRLASQVHVQDR